MRILLISLLALAIQTPVHADSSKCPGLDQIVFHMDIASANIANAGTTRTPEGGAYKKKTAYCTNSQCETLESADYVLNYDPNHPDADPNGYVSTPSIDVMAEMDEMIELQRAYEQRVSECSKVK